ncbi:cytidine deaminase-like protein [Coccomyxa subellipsoidea C-169]|uniref:tRNA-specific adenosine deaminase 2 n=1 Tax=Coccomyxa subellipsoidea (strain C-169) TaxID=574566 RepID=I0YM37_COCSC|nr:cytidine deaminase-like protein [Coccomyxa subellipsoidea C-169]EIE19456.1 cytidine deaminase-like protein [Coccomyxa subellipsoidea C-169]|eukprot:XP_005644000.1 cytidine deaminase-like protein [Coccomyxa subellipsoidea C-169]
MGLQAALEDEVPIGAVLVLDGKVLARAHNKVEAYKDPTAHAEMLVIREAAAQQQGRWYLRDATLYVTLEPCAMCAGAVLVSRVGAVVYGARNSRLGADGSWTRLFPYCEGSLAESGGEEGSQRWPGSPHATHPDLQVRRGVLADECGLVVQQFFQRRRSENKLTN